MSIIEKRCSKGVADVEHLPSLCDGIHVSTCEMVPNWL